MSGVSITGLNPASTLTGAEIVPIVQSGTTVRTTAADLGPIGSFTQAGTGAVETTVQTKLRETVSVKDFGAVGNGIADDTAAIQTAIDAVNTAGGGTVTIPAGTYLISTINAKSNVYISCASGVTFNKTSGTFSDNNNAFNFYGSETATVSSLSANVSLGSSSVTVSSATGFAAGDWCIIRDNVYISGTAGRNQEIVRISSIVGTTINLTTMTIGSYATANSAQIVKIIPVINAILDNAKIVVPIGTHTGGGINLDLCVICSIKNCTIYNPNDNPCVNLSRSYDIAITGNSCFDGQNLSSGGYAYAYCIGESSHHIRVTNNHQENVRESNITNRARYVIFANNTGNNCYDDFVNTHGSGCENVVIANNTCSGGGSGITVGYTTHTAGDKNVIIIGNVISDVNYLGISVNGLVGKEHENIVVTGNTITNSAISASSIALYYAFTNDGACKNNLVNGSGNNNVTYGIQINACDKIDITGNSVNNIPSGYGIALNGSTNCIVSNNTTRDIYSYNYREIGTCTGSQIINNVADDTSIQLSTVKTNGNSWELGGYASAAPATGTYLKGAIVYNNAPASAGYIGWVCTTAGTPGTWKTFGLIS